MTHDLRISRRTFLGSIKERETKAKFYKEVFFKSQNSPECFFKEVSEIKRCSY